MKQYLPILEWLPTYNKKDFRHDLIAGLTVGVMVVPQGMAYAFLAGMPLIYGLYGSIVPLLLYAVLGTSRQLSIGPVAVSSILVLGGISQLAEPESEAYVALAILAGLLIGVMQLLMSFLRLGFLVNFLSRPVISGFTSGAAVLIAVSQLKYMFGMEIPRFEQVHETLYFIAANATQINYKTLLMSIGGIVIILVLKKINKSIPGPLIVALLGIGLVSFFNLDNYGIATVGVIPEGLPEVILPAFTVENVKLVFPTVLTVTIIGVVECSGMAKALEAKHDNYRINPNQELFALGISKIGGAFFQAMPTSGSFSRSAINNESGGRTGVSSVITAILVALVLLFLTPLFYYLPEAILASIVILAVKSLFEFQTAKVLWKNHRNDFWMMLVTFLVTLGVGIEEGVVAGVVLSVLTMTYNSSKPHIAVLGKLSDSAYYRSIDRFPEAVQYDEVLMVRFDAQLYFTNADFFTQTLMGLVKEKGSQLELFILDASSIHEMDSSGLRALEEFHRFLEQRGITFYIASLIGPIRDLLKKTSTMQQIGETNLFMTLHDALECHLCKDDDKLGYWSAAALQSNISNDKK